MSEDKIEQAITGMLTNNDLRDETIKSLLGSMEKVADTLDKNCQLIKSMADSVILLEKRVRNAEGAVKNLCDNLVKAGILKKWDFPKENMNLN